MIKKFFGGIGRTLKPLVNVPAWMGLENLKENNQRLRSLAKSVLTPNDTVVNPETFEEAVERFNMTEADIQARQLYFKRLTFIYCGIALIIFLYGIYLLVFLGTTLGFVMALVVLWIALTLAFKQHFWYTQIKEHRLGLTFKEWFQITFHGRRKS